MQFAKQPLYFCPLWPPFTWEWTTRCKGQRHAENTEAGSGLRLTQSTWTWDRATFYNFLLSLLKGVRDTYLLFLTTRILTIFSQLFLTTHCINRSIRRSNMESTPPPPPREMTFSSLYGPRPTGSYPPALTIKASMHVNVAIFHILVRFFVGSAQFNNCAELSNHLYK